MTSSYLRGGEAQEPLGIPASSRRRARRKSSCETLCSMEGLCIGAAGIPRGGGRHRHHPPASPRGREQFQRHQRRQRAPGIVGLPPGAGRRGGQPGHDTGLSPHSGRKVRTHAGYGVPWQVPPPPRPIRARRRRWKSHWTSIEDGIYFKFIERSALPLSSPEGVDKNGIFGPQQADAPGGVTLFLSTVPQLKTVPGTVQ